MQMCGTACSLAHCFLVYMQEDVGQTANTVKLSLSTGTTSRISFSSRFKRESTRRRGLFTYDMCFCQWWRLAKASTAVTGASNGSRIASFLDVMTWRSSHWCRHRTAMQSLLPDRLVQPSVVPGYACCWKKVSSEHPMRSIPAIHWSALFCPILRRGEWRWKIAEFSAIIRMEIVFRSHTLETEQLGRFRSWSLWFLKFQKGNSCPTLLGVEGWRVLKFLRATMSSRLRTTKHQLAQWRSRSRTAMVMWQHPPVQKQKKTIATWWFHNSASVTLCRTLEQTCGNIQSWRLFIWVWLDTRTFFFVEGWSLTDINCVVQGKDLMYPNARIVSIANCLTLRSCKQVSEAQSWGVQKFALKLYTTGSTSRNMMRKMGLQNGHVSVKVWGSKTGTFFLYDDEDDDVRWEKGAPKRARFRQSVGLQNGHVFSLWWRGWWCQWWWVWERSLFHSCLHESGVCCQFASFQILQVSCCFGLLEIDMRFQISFAASSALTCASSFEGLDQKFVFMISPDQAL